MLARLDTESQQRVAAAGNHLRTSWLKKLTGARSGKRYKVPGTNTYYTASAPGEAPASATGRHRQSVTGEPRSEEGENSYAVGSRLVTFIYLEKGTRHMEPRPSLGPVFDEERERLIAILNEKWF